MLPEILNEFGLDPFEIHEIDDKNKETDQYIFEENDFEYQIELKDLVDRKETNKIFRLLSKKFILDALTTHLSRILLALSDAEHGSELLLLLFVESVKWKMYDTAFELGTFTLRIIHEKSNKQFIYVANQMAPILSKKYLLVSHPDIVRCWAQALSDLPNDIFMNACTQKSFKRWFAIHDIIELFIDENLKVPKAFTASVEFIQDS